MADNKIILLPRADESPAAAADRQAKIKALQQALAEGSYCLDERSLADTLLVDLFWEHFLQSRRPPTPKD